MEKEGESNSCCDKSLTRKPNAIDVRVGMSVRQRRLLLGLSQDDLAAMIGVTFQQIQKYETGETRISASCLYDISQALEVPVAWFFENHAAEDPIDEQVVKNQDSQLPKNVINISDFNTERQLLAFYYDSTKHPVLRRKLLEIARIFSEQEEL